MTFSELRDHIHHKLEVLYPKSEINAFYFILLEYYGKYSKATVLANSSELLSENIAQPILQAIRELQTAKPIQYILGETEFFSNRFFVNENVLIPRPETEELVEWVIEESKFNKGNIKILDIGTGSGCIAVSLAKALPNAVVTAIDVSEEALEVAKRNAELNAVTVHFLQQDILQIDILPNKYDIIISNPPYVRQFEKKEMRDNVLEYEPHLALFVPDNNPLLFYNKIASLAQQSLNPNGSLFFEINQYLGKEMQALLKQKHFTEITLRQDLFGNDRMIKSKQPRKSSFIF
ncbi:release factor glutamine methyltransferase [Capnocytophaga sp. HP1101]